MSANTKTILANVDGWTPLIDSLVHEYGVIGASVFGRIWRYCQMDSGVCSASLSKIGDEIGLDKATVMRYATRLVSDGYLEDMTPDIGNKPHTYRDTGKAGIDAEIKAKPKNNASVAQNNVAENNVAQDNGSVAENNASVAQNNARIRNIKKLSKRDSKKQKPRDATASPPRPRDLVFDALASLCEIDTEPNGCTKDQRGKLNSVAKRLREKFKGKPDEAVAKGVEAFGFWWQTHWWQGQAGTPPDPWDVIKRWPGFVKWHRSNKTRDGPVSKYQNRDGKPLEIAGGKS